MGAHRGVWGGVGELGGQGPMEGLGAVGKLRGQEDVGGIWGLGRGLEGTG